MSFIYLLRFQTTLGNVRLGYICLLRYTIYNVITSSIVQVHKRLFKQLKYFEWFLWHQKIIKFLSQTLCPSYTYKSLTLFFFQIKWTCKLLKECRDFIYIYLQNWPFLDVFIIAFCWDRLCVNLSRFLRIVYLLVKDKRFLEGDITSLEF